MQRTNIYLDDRQLNALRQVGERRGVPMAELVREALDSWLEEQGVRIVGDDEWQHRFGKLMARRRDAAEVLDAEAGGVGHDVMAAVREVRKARAARRR